jgi:hypothetical protein
VKSRYGQPRRQTCRNFAEHPPSFSANTSVNPARSTGPALIQGGVALQQLWLFWVAPLIGGVLEGLAWSDGDAAK